MRQELSLPKEKPNGSELIWSVVDFEGANFRLTSDGVEIAGTARLCLLYQGMEDAAFAWYETSTAVSGILPAYVRAGRALSGKDLRRRRWWNCGRTAMGRCA